MHGTPANASLGEPVAPIPFHQGRGNEQLQNVTGSSSARPKSSSSSSSKSSGLRAGSTGASVVDGSRFGPARPPRPPRAPRPPRPAPFPPPPIPSNPLRTPRTGQRNRAWLGPRTSTHTHIGRTSKARCLPAPSITAVLMRNESFVLMLPSNATPPALATRHTASSVHAGDGRHQFTVRADTTRLASSPRRSSLAAPCKNMGWPRPRPRPWASCR